MKGDQIDREGWSVYLKYTVAVGTLHSKGQRGAAGADGGAAEYQPEP